MGRPFDGMVRPRWWRSEEMMKIALLIALGLGLANFAYQWLTGHNWAVAMERTWFQATACLAVAMAEYFLRRSVGDA